VKRQRKPPKSGNGAITQTVHWALKECVSVMAPEPGGHTRASLIMLVNDTLVHITTVAQSDGSYTTLVHADQPTDVRIVEMKSERYGAIVKP
jgi:hypothetical protein